MTCLLAASAVGCAADTAADDPTAEGELDVPETTGETDDALPGDDAVATESETGDGEENLGTSAAALEGVKKGECSVHVMKPKIGHFGISAASNAWGRCNKAKKTSLHFMMRTKGILGWKTEWNFDKNVPDNGTYDLGGRQVSLAAVSEIYVEATVCWTGKIRYCRSRSATLKNLL